MSEAAILDDDGFRVRGTQPTRVDAFVDAAFAFTVPLLAYILIDPTLMVVTRRERAALAALGADRAA
jgi:hypothetical protein